MYQKSCDLLRPQKVEIILVMVTFILASFGPSATAEEKPAENGWQFAVAP